MSTSYPAACAAATSLATRRSPIGYGPCTTIQRRLRLSPTGGRRSGAGVRSDNAENEPPHWLGARVVVDDHLRRPDDGCAPQLAGSEPRELHMRDHAGRKL